MKFCLSLSGHYRTFDSTYDSWKKHLLEVNNIEDIFMETYDNYGYRLDLGKDQVIPPAGSLHKAQFDEEKILQEGDLRKQYNIKYLNIENYKKISEENNFKQRAQKIKKIIYDSFGQDRRIEWAFSQYYKRLKGIENTLSIDNYDLVFSGRPDFLLNRPINLSELDPEYVHIPVYNNIEGYHDFYLIGNQTNLKKIYNMYFHIETDLCDFIIRKQGTPNKITCGHTLLTQYIHNFTDVKVAPIPLCGYITR